MQAAFHTANRLSFAQAVPGAARVISAYTAMQRSNDASFPFEQEANFWWLTGINEPDWQLIMDGSESWLVQPQINGIDYVFNGGLAAEEAERMSGIHHIISSDEASQLLARLAKKHAVVYTIGADPHAKYYTFVLNPAQKKTWTTLERTFSKVNDCQLDLAKLRAIKQPEEIKAMQKAINLTIEGFEHIKELLPTLSYEYEIEAEFDYLFRRKSRAGHAYDPIVAAGKNACTLHYNTNTMRLKKPGLVLMDIGARVDGYAADITRTYAVGTPTKRQKEVHQAVETAHHRIISLLKPGLSVQAYFEQVDDIMKEALKSLGLLTSADDYRRYFPHSVSHGLGVDVHDSLGRPSELLSGMVLTVEPGIYIPEEGIGVRIEDDILITDTGHRNLSQKLPTEL